MIAGWLDGSSELRDLRAATQVGPVKERRNPPQGAGCDDAGNFKGP
jgi:hypothetical protein